MRRCNDLHDLTAILTNRQRILGINVIPWQDLYLYQFPLSIFLDSLDAFCGTGVLIYPHCTLHLLDATAFTCTNTVMTCFIFAPFTIEPTVPLHLRRVGF